MAWFCNLLFYRGISVIVPSQDDIVNRATHLPGG